MTTLMRLLIIVFLPVWVMASIEDSQGESYERLERKIRYANQRLALAKESERGMLNIAQGAYRSAATSRALMITSTVMVGGAVAAQRETLAAVMTYIQKEIEKLAKEKLLKIKTVLIATNLSALAVFADTFKEIRVGMFGANIEDLRAINDSIIKEKVDLGLNFNEAHARIREMINAVDLNYPRWKNIVTLGSKDKEAVMMLYSLYVADRVLWEKEIQYLESIKTLGSELGWFESQ